VPILTECRLYKDGKLLKSWHWPECRGRPHGCGRHSYVCPNYSIAIN
jgi:hypothetical protein